MRIKAARVLLLKTSKRYQQSENSLMKATQRFHTLCSSYFKARYLGCILLGCLIASASQSHADVDTVWDTERALYKKARQALNKNQINQFGAYQAKLTHYPLYPYLVFDELIARLAKISDEEVDAFLVTYSDGPLATRLRLTWLFQLLKADRWERFLKYYQDDDSTELLCYFLRAKVRLGEGENYISQIRDVWLVGKSQPKQCDSLFEWYEEQGFLTTEQIWERFSLAMENNQVGLAQYLSKKLPASEHASAQLWLTTHNNPKRILFSAALQKDNHINRKIIRHGLQRLARKNIDVAYESWLAIEENYAFGSDLHDEVERNLALRAAYRHDVRATTWMYELPKDVVDASTGMWRARSAMRSLDWDLVLRGIAMLSEQEKNEPQWQYWKARALAEKGLQSDANALYKNIANDRSYYGFLAADKIAIPYNINNIPVQYDIDEYEQIAQLPAIIRTRELLLVKQFTDARREWNFATRSFTERQFQIAASIAHQWQWHDYAIRTIAKGNYFDDLAIRFPTPFDSLVNKYSVKCKLEPAFVYGIIRRESAFNAQARSPVGARGLMQLMPATAKQVSKQLKLKAPRRQDLYTPSFNINLGSTYISDMLKKFNGHRALASAAYNAGPHRVNAWLPEQSELPADVWVDTIPFTETREYVRAILAYTALFEWKMNKNPTRLSVHLQPIPPTPKS